MNSFINLLDLNNLSAFHGGRVAFCCFVEGLQIKFWNAKEQKENNRRGQSIVSHSRGKESFRLYQKLVTH